MVAGKPHPPTVGYIRDRMLGPAGDRPAVVVGDQPGTDGALAERLGLPFVLVDSGVTAPGAPVDGVPVALRCADFVSRSPACHLLVYPRVSKVLAPR